MLLGALIYYFLFYFTNKRFWEWESLIQFKRLRLLEFLVTLLKKAVHKHHLFVNETLVLFFACSQ